MAHLSNRDEDIPKIVDEIVATYDALPSTNHLSHRALPSHTDIREVLEGLKEVLYPGYFGRRNLNRANIRFHIGDRIWQLYRQLGEQIYLSVLHDCRLSETECGHCETLAEDLTMEFLHRIPAMRAVLADDVQAAFDGDPAARSLDEIIFSYPGLDAITVHRIAHELWNLNVPLVARIMSETAHSNTGIDIHPGAHIGASFFIDHGTGVVIGETSQIGNHVKLYQGVTLGALSFQKDAAGRLVRGTKRHPTIEDDVTIYSGATILGGETVVGRGSTVGGNVWLTHSVPPHTVVMMEDPALVVADKKSHKVVARKAGAAPVPPVD
jgi:serine O-acetyltransferase